MAKMKAVQVPKAGGGFRNRGARYSSACRGTSKDPRASLRSLSQRCPSLRKVYFRASSIRAFRDTKSPA